MALRGHPSSPFGGVATEDHPPQRLQRWNAFMSRRTLTILITLLFVLLALAVFSSERGVAGVLEQIGAVISKFFD